ncbi:MAG: flagellar hook-length control protein FliK, partial [Oscillospiraceae bacterium]|nr:flagellar hook-length control protein FliK [Oscillospiraceae bacterium]
DNIADARPFSQTASPGDAGRARNGADGSTEDVAGADRIAESQRHDMTGESLLNGLLSRILTSVAQIRDLGAGQLAWLTRSSAPLTADGLAAARHVADNTYSFSMGISELEAYLASKIGDDSAQGGYGFTQGGHGQAGSSSGGAGVSAGAGAGAGADGGSGPGEGAGSGQGSGLGSDMAMLYGVHANAFTAPGSGSNMLARLAANGIPPDQAGGGEANVKTGGGQPGEGVANGSSNGNTFGGGGGQPGAGGSANGGAGDSASGAAYRQALRDLADIRAFLPRSDLAALKNGVDISDIYNELKARLLALESKFARLFGKQDETVERIISSMKDNVRAQEQMNKGPVCFQIPFMYNQKPSSLTVYVFDRQRGGRARKPGDALSVALNLETQSMGTVDIGMNVSDKRVDLDITVQNKGVRNYLESIAGTLGERVRGAGFAVGTISCSVAGANAGAGRRQAGRGSRAGAPDSATVGDVGGRGHKRARDHPGGRAQQSTRKAGYAGVDIKV